MKHKVVPVNNLARLAEAGEALITRHPGEPGMGLIWGPTGYGKSTGSAWFMNQVDGIYVRANQLWTPSAMLRALCQELDLPEHPHCSKMLDAVIRALAEDPRAVFIDEADYVVASRKLVETLRDIHDLTTVPIVLIGEENLKKKLAANKRLLGRVAQWVAFQRATIKDARKLADELCEVGVADDLVERVHAETEGEIRLIVIGLRKIEDWCKQRGIKKASSDNTDIKQFSLRIATAKRASA